LHLRSRLWVAVVRLTVAVTVAGAVAYAAGPPTIERALAAAPCTMTWTGAANDGKWETPANWNPTGPPGAGDYACIPSRASTVVTLSSPATILGADEQSQGLVVNGGLTLTDPVQASTINNVTLNGSLGSNATLTLTGNATWSNGSLFGSGTLINRDILTVATNGIVNLFGHLINSGNFHAGAGNAPTLCIFDGDVFENAAHFDIGGFIVDGSGGSCGSGAGSGRLLNDLNAFLVNNGQIRSLFDNHGVVELGGGSLRIRNGNSPGQTDTGTYATSPGQGSIFFEGGTRNFAAVNILGGDETGTGVYLTGGTLTGTISVIGNMYWGTTNQTGGSFANATIIGPGTLHLSTNGTLTLAGNLTNQANIDGQGHGFSDTLCLNDGVTLHNDVVTTTVVGRITLPPGGLRVCAGQTGTGLVLNGGLISSSLGTGSTVITAPFTNDTGVLAVDSGVISIEGPFSNYDPVSKTLTGGAYLANSVNGVVQSTIRFANADIVNLAAEIDFFGAVGAISDLSNVSALRDLATIAPTGGVSLIDHTFSDPSSLANDGTVFLGPAATLNVGGAYTQGRSGQLTFFIEGSPASGQFGKLAVTGNVTQDGVMNIEMPGPFATLGDEYLVMPYGSVSGSFAQVNGTAIDATKMFELDYRATGLVLVVVPTPQADAPVSMAGMAVSSVEGSQFSGPVATFTDPDAAATAAEYTASIDWGDGTTSSGTITLANGTFTVSGSHTYAEEGAFTVSVTVTDADLAGNTATASATATVADGPLSAAGMAISGVEGLSTSGTVATFTDADPNGTASDYTATIDWGDGSTSAGTVTASASGGFTVTGAHTYAEEGSHSVGVSIADAGGSNAAATGSATVADAPLAATGLAIGRDEGSSFNGPVAVFTDGDPNAAPADYTVTINWGDGSTSPGTVTAAASGGFTVIGSHAYAEEGTYTVAVAITDAGGSQAASSSRATIADAQLSATGSTVTGVEGQPFHGAVATFSDGDPNGAAADYTVTISWGDGGTSFGTVTAAAGGGFIVSGAHAYAEEGAYAVVVHIADAGGSTASAQSSATVADAALSATGTTFTVRRRTTFTNTVASFSDVDPNGSPTDYHVVIDWGDGTTSAGTIVAAPNGGFDVAGTHAYARRGTKTVTVTITDAGGSVAVAHTTISVLGRRR